MLTECETYQRLTNGSPIADVSPFLDGDILAARGVPETAVDDDGVLLLQPGRFTTLGVAAGDLVGLRVTAHGFELAAVQEPTPCDIGAALAALLAERPDRPEMLDVAIWTVCAGDDGLFREPAAPPTPTTPSAQRRTTYADFAANSSSSSPDGRAAPGFRRWPRAPSLRCSPSATRSSRASSPASAALGWVENPRPGPASTATTNRSAPTCRPSSTTWPSRPRRRSPLEDSNPHAAHIDNELSIGNPQAASLAGAASTAAIAVVSGTDSASAIPPTVERAISMATLSLVSTSLRDRLATLNSSSNGNALPA